ncbi:MAG: sulfurtransferase [Alphaproteobacteria bacterium]
MTKQAIDKGIIEPEALRVLLEKPGSQSIKILDASLPAPGSGRSAMQGFHEKRIAGTVFFDIDAVSDHSAGLPHMLPAPELFETYAARLGISHNDLVVIYGQDGLIMGPARAWWMFRVFGHDKVVVLDGGLPAWLDLWYPVAMGLPKIPKPSPGNFKATFRPVLLAARGQVAQAMDSKDAMILDARPFMRFNGEAPEPRPGLLSGHIPHSLNLPAVMLVDKDTRKLKDAEEIEGMAESLHLKDKTQIIATCGSGVTACVIALALYRIGYPKVAVYDGSWAEWGQEGADMPVAFKP